MMRRLVGLLWVLLVAGQVVAAEPEAGRIAPAGVLRAAINFGNPVLAQIDQGTGEAVGVSVALARELGRRLGIPVTLVRYQEAGLVAAAATRDAWDVAFLAIDPTRGATIEFTAPYVSIEGTYAVPAGSKLETIEAVDRSGVRIGVAANSAYDLFLSRTLKSAELVRMGNGAEAEAAFLEGRVEALAGVKQPLVALALAHPELRLIPGRFMAIRQAMAVPKEHADAIPYLQRFIAEMKSSGFVRTALDATGQRNADVAPAE